jgi:NAD(P)-dependent dehydrogenase (short-subunit alcohol dehydrogenase family)
MPRIAVFGPTSELAEAIIDCLSRQDGQVVRVAPAAFNSLAPANEDAIAAAFDGLGAITALVCVTLDPRSTGTGLLSWARWTEASRGIATTALLGLRHGGPLVQPGGAIVLVAAPGPSDPASEAAHGILLGLSRGASGGFAARGIRVNRVATDFTRNAADQAEAVAFLVSDAARFVTGADIGRGRQEER